MRSVRPGAVASDEIVVSIGEAIDKSTRTTLEPRARSRANVSAVTVTPSFWWAPMTVIFRDASPPDRNELATHSSSPGASGACGFMSRGGTSCKSCKGNDAARSPMTRGAVMRSNSPVAI